MLRTVSSSLVFWRLSRATESSWLATTSSWFLATAFSNVETSRLSTCCRPALTRNFCPASVTSSVAAASSSSLERRGQQGLHPAEEVVGLVGLGDVVVGPGIEPADDVDRIGESGEQDEGHSPQGGIGLHRLAEVVAGGHRHLDIRDDDVGPPLPGHLQGRLAVLRPADGVAGIGEPLLQNLAPASGCLRRSRHPRPPSGRCHARLPHRPPRLR